MLGLTKREIQRRFDEIVEFAELKDFIDAPVKTYSSGMYMRLGFAVAIHVDPDVLLIDEVLAVGDQAFTVKCLDKFAEFRRRNKTILLVTHSLDLVEKFCDRALWLDKGKTLAEGEPKRVVAAYLIDVEKAEEAQLAEGRGGRQSRRSRRRASRRASAAASARPMSSTTPADMFQATEGRWGSREVEITEVTLARRATAQPAHVFQSGDADRGPARRRARTSRPTTSCSASACSTPTASAATAPTRTSKSSSRRRSSGEGEIRVPHREPRSGRGHLQDRRRRAQARRLSLRLPPAALHLPREVAHQGRRHLSARASLGVHAEHPLQAPDEPAGPERDERDRSS